MNKASKKSYKDGSLKTVDRRIFNGMSRMWEKFLRYADDDHRTGGGGRQPHEADSGEI